MAEARVRRLQERLEALADERTRDWWTRYLKGTAQFRGVPMARIREAQRAWRAAEGLDALPPRARLDLALALLRAPMTEDKLAAMLWFEDGLGEDFSWQDLLKEFEPLFQDGHLADWGAVDWFCVKVLGPLVGAHGLPCARAVARWTRAPGLWHARAGLVAFVYLTGREEFRPLVLDGAARLIAREERFAKTAVGWALRELSKHDPEAVRRFVAEHRAHFSREALANATKHLSAPRRPRGAAPAKPRTSPAAAGSAAPRRRKGGPAPR